MDAYIRHKEHVEEFDEFNARVVTIDDTDDIYYNYFATPSRVKFFDSEIGKFVGGIGYKSIIIDGRDGSEHKIAEIYDHAPTSVTPIMRMEWRDLSLELKSND